MQLPPLRAPPVPAPARSTFSHSHVPRTAKFDHRCGKRHKARGVADHQVLHIGGAQQFQAHCHGGGGGGLKAGGPRCPVGRRRSWGSVRGVVLRVRAECLYHCSRPQLLPPWHPLLQSLTGFIFSRSSNAKMERGGGRWQTPAQGMHLRRQGGRLLRAACAPQAPQSKGN